MPDGEIRRHVRYVLTSTNLYPSELHNAMRRLLSGQPADRNRRETAKEACRIFSEYGNREYQGEVLYRTELRGKAGMAMSFGANGYTYLSWNAIANAVHTLIAAGEYPEEIETPNEIPEYTDALVTAGGGSVQPDAAYSYEYRLLGRLRSDCEYYLDYGRRANKHLWAGNVETLIAKMRELYHLLPVKPEWLTEQEIDSYEERMTADTETISVEPAPQIPDEVPAAEKAAVTDTEATVQKHEQKNDRESRNYHMFARLFPDVLSKKYQYLHLESDGFEPLSLEWLSGGELSMMQTYEQNGDLMRDPDMVLRINTEEQTIQAASFEQSSLGLYQEVFTEAGCDMNLMKELDDFLSQWLSNIAVQGYAPVRAIEAVNGEEQEILFNEPETAATEQKPEPMSPPPSEQISFFSDEPAKEADSQMRDEVVLPGGHSDISAQADNLPVRDPVIVSASEQKAVLEASVLQPFRYIPGTDLYPRGDKSKYQANVTAIKLLRHIEAERRPATPEEQTVLARYCGWGGLSNAFNDKSDGWAREYQELKSLLTKEEYQAAMESTLTAYYTDPEIIRQIYRAVESFGFEGGADRKILDPATGTGNFFSVLPEGWQGTKLYGTEIDSITGRIARLLYPQADIQVRGFEAAGYEDNSFDVCIGNIPFNSIKVYDPRYWNKNFFIHDYFFAKSLDLTKPGGIIAYITTSGTLDRQDASMRRYIAERAEFIGAIRLPNTAFKATAGTEVTSDIVFLKKRPQPVTNVSGEYWIGIELGKEEKRIWYNSYFHHHPEMVLGEIKPGRMYGREKETTCVLPEGCDLYSELERAVGRLHAVFDAEPDRPADRFTADEIDEQPEYENAPEGTKNCTFIIREDTIYYCEDNKLIPQPYTGKKAERIKGLCDIRTALLDVIAVQTRPYEESELMDKQSALNAVYDRFVSKHGAINSKGNILAFSDDDQFPLLRSIENEIKEKDGSVRYEKAQIFTKATIRPQVVPDHADTAEDALYISLNTRMKVDLRYMSALTGKEPFELTEKLGDKIYLNPRNYYGNILEGWETAEEYLSGNVRDKLLYAKVKAEEYPNLFARNVAALEAVQPAPLKPADIDASIGAPWIPLEIYQQFMYETFETPQSCRAVGNPRYDKYRIALQYMEYTTAWFITSKARGDDSITAYQTYGTKRKNAYELYEDCLNQQSTVIRDRVAYKDENGNKKVKYVVNPAETRIARAKQTQIKEAFAAWIWKDAERRDILLNIYNDRFNVYVPREYDGSHLVFPGMSAEEHLRPHQADFAARVIYSGRGLAAHEVGAGKTAALIAAGMYLKSLGAIRKPVYVVPNPLVGQWATEFYRFFPSARLLVSAGDEFSAKKRGRHVSRIAMGDYDAIILAHSQFERIPISVERQKNMLQEQINQISQAIEKLNEQAGENWSVKQMVRFRKNLKAQLDKLSAAGKKDDLLTFEELGIDFMFIDEAHMFKNCFVHTKLSRIAGVNTTSSQRAFDVLMKCQYLQEINNGRGVVFATGTPVSNSMSEMYVMMRYLEPDVLRDMGVSDFDSWAATFGRIVASLEITPEGGGWRMRQRFARFVNLPELMQAYRLVADIQTADMLKLERPSIKGGKAEVISTDVTEFQRDIMEGFVERAEAIRAGRIDPHEDNMLKLTGEARLMAIDPRLIDRNAPNDPQTKLNLCIDNVFCIWQDTAADRLTQLVFCDVSTPGADDAMEMQEASEGAYEKSVDRFTNVYEEIRKCLVRRGVPEEEVAFIHDAKSDPQRQAMFEQMREGKICILLGSTGKLGTGVNVQDRVIAIHHLDVPWKPSDITQRDGRGLRQGNINPEIMIFHYITVGTFDAYLWQIQQQKLTYISQVMTGKCIARSCEDMDETVLTAAQFKAVATDNPALLEKIELENRVSELKLLQRNYENEQAELEKKITRIYPARIARCEKNIKEIAADVGMLKKTEGKGFSVILEGKRYDKRAEAGKKLLTYAGPLKGLEEETRRVGEYRDFTLSIYKTEWLMELCLDGNHSYTCGVSETAIGTVSRLENLAEQIPRYLDDERHDLENIKIQLEAAKKAYGVPFAYEAELAEKSARLSEVETELELGKGDDQDVIMDEEVSDEANHAEDSPEAGIGIAL